MKAALGHFGAAWGILHSASTKNHRRIEVNPIALQGRHCDGHLPNPAIYNRYMFYVTVSLPKPPFGGLKSEISTWIQRWFKIPARLLESSRGMVLF
jgi:hypothetical protein